VTRLEAVRLLKLTQDALEELDRHNLGSARSLIFDLNWQLREAIKRIELEDDAHTP
jgi:CRP-like cAMP-binding protein